MKKYEIGEARIVTEQGAIKLPLVKMFLQTVNMTENRYIKDELLGIIKSALVLSNHL